MYANSKNQIRPKLSIVVTANKVFNIPITNEKIRNNEPVLNNSVQVMVVGNDLNQIHHDHENKVCVVQEDDVDDLHQNHNN